MAVELLSQLKRIFDGDAIASLSTALDESPDRVASVLAQGGPSILAGLLQSASGHRGPQVLEALRRESDAPLGLDVSSGGAHGVRRLVESGSLDAVVHRGQTMLRSIFGDRFGAVVDLIADGAGASSATATSLLGLLAPTILKTIRDALGTSGFNLDGLRRLLGGEMDAITRQAPAGLDSVLGLSSLAGLGTAAPTRPAATTHAVGERPAVAVSPAPDVEASMSRWSIPLTLGVLALIAAFYLLPGERPRNPMDEPPQIPKVEPPSTDLAAKPAPAPRTDESRPIRAEDATTAAPNATLEDRPVVETAARRVIVELPGGGVLEVPEKSYVEQMALTLREGAPAVSKTFVAGDLMFDRDGKLTAEANEAVERLAKLAQAYPETKWEVNGRESPDEGAGAETRERAKAHADAVRDALVAAGVPAERVTAQAVGPNLPAEHPAAEVQDAAPVSISIGPK